MHLRPAPVNISRPARYPGYPTQRGRLWNEPINSHWVHYGELLGNEQSPYGAGTTTRVDHEDQRNDSVYDATQTHSSYYYERGFPEELVKANDHDDRDYASTNPNYHTYESYFQYYDNNNINDLMYEDCMDKLNELIDIRPPVN